MIHYATEALGFSRSRAFYFLDLARRIDDLPELREAVADGRLGWTKAVQVARVATPETDAAWVEQATAVTRQELQRKIQRARRQTRQKGAEASGAVAPQLELEPGPANSPAPVPEPPAAVDLRLRASQTEFARYQALLEKLRKSRKVPRGWSSMEVVLAGLEELLEAEAGEDEPPESSRVDSDGHAGGEAAARPGQSSRVDSPPHWQVVAHRCEECGRVSVPAGGDGQRVLPRAESERIGCDALVVRTDGNGRSAIPPRVRRAAPCSRATGTGARGAGRRASSRSTIACGGRMEGAETSRTS